MDKGGLRREILRVLLLVGSAICGVIGIGIDPSQNHWLFAEKLLTAIVSLVLLLSVLLINTSDSNEDLRTNDKHTKKKIIRNKGKKNNRLKKGMNKKGAKKAKTKRKRRQG